MPSDHPRACGVHSSTRQSSLPVTGSSPRLRGAPDRVGLTDDRRRIIPAPAGCTTTAARAAAAGPDHPRACGVHLGGGGVEWAPRGSSPRLRGALQAEHDGHGDHRIIPAPAGCTAAQSECPAGPSDHPRACGVHGSPTSSDVALNGSSPRLRGALSGALGMTELNRIIPAPAGCTRLSRSWPAGTPDHPRACGVHLPNPRTTAMKAGSSPRLRGARDGRRWDEGNRRIIPAPAGCTPNDLVAPLAPTDHPRACGVHVVAVAIEREDDGSSPRLRGAHDRDDADTAGHRIIPAPAGCTVPEAVECRREMDHPRACGVHEGLRHRVRPVDGSSPRLRGALL